MSSDFMGSDTEPEVKSEGGSDKENVEEAKQGPPDSKKGKKRVIERGRHSTPEKRAKQFPEVMGVRGDALWCLACDCTVGHYDKSLAVSHVKSKKHLANVAKKLHYVKAPGPSALQASSSSQSSEGPWGQFPRALNRGKLFREQKNILFLKKKFYH